MKPRNRLGLATPKTLPGPVHIGPRSGAVELFRREHSFALPAWNRESIPSLDSPTVPLPIGSRDAQPCDICFILDDSGSTGGTDPNAFRYVAARRIVNLLADGVGGPRLDDRIAVIHFADHARPWLPLTSIRKKPQRNLIRQSLRQLTGGGTAIVPPIDLAATLLRSGHDAKIAILFTDGESGETAAQLADAVAKLPVGALHVIVLGSVLPAQWLDVPVGSVTALADLSTADAIEWAMARALYTALSLGWGGPDKPPSAARATRQ